jgi:hypothetical protein
MRRLTPPAGARAFRAFPQHIPPRTNGPQRCLPLSRLAEPRPNPEVGNPGLLRQRKTDAPLAVLSGAPEEPAVGGVAATPT